MSPTQSLSLNTWSSNGSVLNCSLLPFLGIFFFSHFLTLVVLTKLVMNKTVKKNFGKVQCWQCQQQIWCFLLKVLYWRTQFFTPCGSMNSCFSISYLYHHLWLELNNYISNSWLGFLSLDHRDSALTLFFFLPLVIYPINVANYAWTFLVITWDLVTKYTTLLDLFLSSTCTIRRGHFQFFALFRSLYLHYNLLHCGFMLTIHLWHPVHQIVVLGGTFCCSIFCYV